MEATRDMISWDDFMRVEIRSGTITRVEDFLEARKPAYKVWVDFGETIGVKKTSAQITVLYSKDELVGKQILGVVNFPPKQIGKFMSEFLLMGFPEADGSVVLAVPERTTKNGTRLA